MKIIPLIFILLFISPFSNRIYGQDKKLSFGIIFSPAISNFTSNNASFKAGYTSAFSYDLGFLLLKKISSQIDFRAGLTYSRMSKKLSWDNGAMYNGIIYNKFIAKDYDYYIEMPLGFNFYLLQSKIKFYLLTGAKPQFYLFTKEKDYYYSNNSSSVVSIHTGASGLRRLNIKLFGGVGLSFPSDNLTFCIEPVFNYTLINYFSGNNISIHPYSFGLNLVFIH